MTFGALTWEDLREVQAFGREGQEQRGAEDAVRVRAEYVVAIGIQLCRLDDLCRVEGGCILPDRQPGAAQRSGVS